MGNKISWLAALGVAVVSFSVAAVEVDVRAHKDGYSSKGGKVTLWTGGRESAVTSEVTFHNGSRLLPDGFIVFRDGRRERFDESRWLNVEGEYIVVDAGTTDDFDGYYFEDGRVYVYRDRQPVLLTVEFTFGDGSRILPDGSFYSHDGSRSRMSEGQRVSKLGKSVEGKHTATNRTATNPANPTPTAPANATTPPHAVTPAAPVDASHKAVEPAKTREPAEHEKAVTPAPVHEKATAAPEHEKAEKKPEAK